jgi:hypothetical protein
VAVGVEGPGGQGADQPRPEEVGLADEQHAGGVLGHGHDDRDQLNAEVDAIRHLGLTLSLERRWKGRGRGVFGGDEACLGADGLEALADVVADVAHALGDEVEGFLEGLAGEARLVF